MRFTKLTLWATLILLCQAKSSSLDTLPFPQFHREYFKGNFWERSDSLDHSLFALRSPLAESEAESLLVQAKVNPSFVPALLVYNLTRDTVFKESTLNHLLAYTDSAKSSYLKKKIFFETLNWLKKTTADSLRLSIYDEYTKKDKALDKSLGRSLRKEYRQLRLQSWLASGRDSLVLKNWRLYLDVANREQAKKLLPKVQKKLVPSAMQLDLSSFTVLVRFLDKSSEKSLALKLVEKYPGSKQKKNSDKRKYYTLLAQFRENAKDYAGQYRVLNLRFRFEGKSKQASTLDEMIRVSRKMGNYAQADSLLDELEKLSPRSSKVAGQLWLRAFELEQDKKYSEARQKYRELHERFPGHRRQTWASFRAGLVEYKAKDYESALSLFDQALKDQQSLWPRSASLYFSALTYQKLGRDSLAKAAFYNAIDDYPMGYFAWRARQNLHRDFGIALHNVPLVETFEADRQKTYEWLEQTTEAAPAPDSLLPYVEALLAAGAWSWVDDLMAQKKSYTHIDRIDFGRLLFRYGYLAKSYAQGRSLFNALDRKRMYYFPKPLADLMFPQVYPTEVAKGLENSKLPVEFVWALMRQESIFDDQISSPVGAMGLMQIMDYTGKELAALEGVNFEAYWLKNPLFAIRLGTRYLKDLYSEYGKYWWVLTNYNAGPKPTKRWIKETEGLEYDVALEDISFWETRDYVKKVLGNYFNYLSLSGAPVQRMITDPLADQQSLVKAMTKEVPADSTQESTSSSAQ